MHAAFVWAVFQAELSPMTFEVAMCQVIRRQPEGVKVHLLKKVGDQACAKELHNSAGSCLS